MRTLVLKYFFGASLAAALAGAALFLFVPPTLGTPQRAFIVTAFLALAALSAWGRSAVARWGAQVMLAVTLLAIAIIATAGWLQGTGTGTPGMVFMGLIVCMVAAVAPRWATAWVAVAALLALALLAGADALAGPQATALTLQRLVVGGLSVGVGLAAGRALARLSASQVAAAAAREQRFRALLAIAVQAYWETDADLLLTQLLRRSASGGFEPVPVPRRRPGGLPGLSFDESLLAEARQAMERRVAFHDLPARWDSPHGVRHLRISGEPNIGPGNRFIGYWGVARDVTDEWEAQQA
ncbi:MAG: hypothetical protein JNM08_09595, partial [Rubrivivax sp.]|nr:hypothetical protein [Rubrivivax sp.]